ncbi:MAG: hypothetical protein HRU19_27340 [Pseudobacteriovorax sp.]|nr:hypothetical protein [Pseudobacteriovorax sp.]
MKKLLLVFAITSVNNGYAEPTNEEAQNQWMFSSKVRLDFRNRTEFQPKSLSSSAWELQFLNLSIKKQVKPQTSFHAALKGESTKFSNNTPQQDQSLDFRKLFLKHKIGDSSQISFGKIKVQRGGFSANEPKIETVRFDNIIPQLPKKFQTGLHLSTNVNGWKLSGQSFNGKGSETTKEQKNHELGHQFSLNKSFGSLSLLASYGRSAQFFQKTSEAEVTELQRHNAAGGVKWGNKRSFLSLDYVIVRTSSYQLFTAEGASHIQGFTSRSFILNSRYSLSSVLLGAKLAYSPEFSQANTSYKRRMATAFVGKVASPLLEYRLSAAYAEDGFDQDVAIKSTSDIIISFIGRFH